MFLAPANRLKYQLIVDTMSAELLASLGEFNFGWRLERGVIREAQYADQNREWSLFVKARQHFASTTKVLLKLDVRSFYPSIPFAGLDRLLGKKLIGRDTYAQGISLLTTLYEDESGLGLPQNHLPSAVLANAYLATALQEIENTGSGQDGIILRWMDDIWIFGETTAAVCRLQGSVESALDAASLALNPSKTKLYEQSTLSPRVFDERKPADSGCGPRSSRMADLSLRGSGLPALLSREPRDGQVKLGDLASDGTLTEVDLRSAQRYPAAPGIVDLLISVLSDPACSPLRHAVAAHAAAMCLPAVARELLREVVRNVACPHKARTCVLAALAAGEETSWVVRALADMPADEMLRAFLADARGSNLQSFVRRYAS